MNKNQSSANDFLDPKDYQKALQSFLDLLQENPDDGSVYQGIAKCYYELKKYDEAVAAAKRAINLDKNLSLPHLVLAYTYIGQGSFENALAEAQDAYNLLPESEDAGNCYGALLLIRGKVDDGISTLRKIIELHPKSILAYENLANAYKMKKDFRNYTKAMSLLFQYQPSIINTIKLLVAYQQRYALPLVLIIFTSWISAWLLEIRALLIIPSIYVIYRLFVDITYLVSKYWKEQGKVRNFLSSFVSDLILGIITYGVYFIMATK